ncbi:MAG: type IV pilus modification protein PilV [Marinobacter sp.]|nr:type IV pilus modification protein PilV [Marinobacter sp.]
MIRQQRGVGMIEILVATLIFAIGLLGVAGMQVFTLKMNSNSEIRTRATLLASDIVERMRANPSQWNAYSMGTDECATAVAGSPSSTDVAALDRRQWCLRLARELPASEAEIVIANEVVTVNIRWQEREGRELVDADGAGTGSEQSTNEFVLRARLGNA